MKVYELFAVGLVGNEMGSQCFSYSWIYLTDLYRS